MSSRKFTKWAVTYTLSSKKIKSWAVNKSIMSSRPNVLTWLFKLFEKVTSNHFP